MLILTNCLTDKEDEGCLKVANSLVKRMRNIRPEILIVSYERKSALTDVFLKLNKFMLNKSLISLLRKKNESVLYIPFPAKTIVTAVRVFLLSLFVKKDLDVICVLKYRLNWLAKFLWRVSRAKVVVFSKDSEIFYKDILGASRVRYLKTGIDTEKFKPVSKEEVLNLKKKYGFDENRPIILHVGH